MSRINTRMNLPTLVLTLTVICHGGPLEDTNKLTLPDDLFKWCPYSTFCRQKMPVNNQTELPTHRKSDMPCCSSCSCSQDCGLKRNCCTDEYDLYKLDETLGTICKQLLSYEDLPKEPSYHIINKCPNRSELCSPQIDDNDEYYFPVYSKGTGMIYYNEKCAECNQQYTSIRFNQMFICDKQSASYFGLLFKKSGCTLRFRIPNGVDVSSELCYPNVKNECFPRNGSEALQHLCDSFNATFHTRGITKYRNVFCYLCSSKREINPESMLQDLDFCPDDSDEKGFGGSTFAIILDPKINHQRDKDYLRSAPFPEWCGMSKDKRECRSVFCPEGHIFIDGKCRVYGRRWYFNKLGFNVRLSTPSGHRKCLLTDFPVDTRSLKTSIYIERPGFEQYDLNLYYNLETDNLTVRYFLAVLMYDKISVEPKSFVENIRTSLSTHWKLYLDEKMYTLVPELDKYVRYEQVPSADGVKISPAWQLFTSAFSDEDKQKENLKIMKLLHGNISELATVTSSEAFFITKLFLCNLVELLDNEYDDLSTRLSLKNGSTHIEDGEYTWVLIEDDQFRARICLRDLPGYSGTMSVTFSKVYWSPFILKVYITMIFSLF